MVSSVFRCPSLFCPLDSLPPPPPHQGQAHHGQLAPQGATFTGISWPPTLVIFTPRGQNIPAGLSYPPGMKISQPGNLAPHLGNLLGLKCIVWLATAISSFGYAYHYSFIHRQAGWQPVPAGLTTRIRSKKKQKKQKRIRRKKKAVVKDTMARYYGIHLPLL